MSTLNQIVWISEAKRKYSQEELFALLKKARANNIKHQITGLLLYDDMSFMQLMEGDRTSVEDIFENRIKPSRLHTRVTLLAHREIEERNFENWSMGFMSSKHRKIQEIPGFRDFSQTHTSFLDLAGDASMTKKIIDGFHDGKWHLGQSIADPNPVLSTN